MRFIKSQDQGEKRYEKLLDELVHIENIYSIKLIPDAVKSVHCVKSFSSLELLNYKLENCMRNKKEGK